MSWMAVAKKEFLENVRNAWVIAVSVVFLVLTLLASAFAALTTNPAGGPGLARIGLTLNIMDNISGFLLPILALMLGFGTIAGERESGSLGLLMAQPLRRGEIVVGKWLGLFGVLATAVLVGFGVGGGVVLARTAAGAADVSTLLLFMVEALAWGAAWISVTMLLSSFFNRRGTAIAGSIGTWFFFSTLVWQLISFLFLAAVLGGRFQDLRNAPNWAIIPQWLNPNTAFAGLAATTIPDFEGITSTIGRALVPDMYKPIYFGLALAAWIVIPFYGAYLLFERKDA